METIEPPKTDNATSPKLTPLQIEAITEFNALLHPAALVSFVQSSNRDQWRKIADYMDALKALLPAPPEPTKP